MTRRLARPRAGRLAFAAAAIAMQVIGGCGSVPQTHFHSLMPPPVAVAKPLTAAGPLAWEVLPVGVPAQVDQPQWVVRADDDSLAVLEQERWIAPLGDEIRAVVTGQLNRVVGPALPPGPARDAWRVRIDAQRFDSAPGRYAQIEAAWTITSSGAGAASLTCRGVFSEPVGAGFPALAAGHRKAVQRLADAVAEEVRSLAEGRGPGCSG